jgi:hypothetical protein
MSACDEKITNLKDQIARPSIANCYLLAGAKTIKDRNSDTKQWDLKTLRCLPAVRMSDEQISSNRPKFEIFQVAHQDLVDWNGLKHGRRCRCDCRLNLASHFMKPMRHCE